MLRSLEMLNPWSSSLLRSTIQMILGDGTDHGRLLHTHLAIATYCTRGGPVFLEDTIEIVLVLETSSFLRFADMEKLYAIVSPLDPIN